MLVLVATSALAAWTETARANDCIFYKGAAEGEVTPVKAECDWPIAAEKLQAILAKVGDHDLYFSAVEESTVLGPTTSGDLVYQSHKASGISDREIVLVMGSESIPDGKRFTWTAAADQSKVTGEKVQIPLDTGKWEVTSRPAGSHVVYELRYLAGGSVPGFLVRWFQGAGVQALVGELRTWAETH
jgi:hypothetical protein